MDMGRGRGSKGILAQGLILREGVSPSLFWVFGMETEADQGRGESVEYHDTNYLHLRSNSR